MKILLAVDGSTCSDRAVDEVARLPWLAGSEVQVINVIETPLVLEGEPFALPTYFEELQTDLRRNAQAIVDAAVSKLKTREDEALKITSEIVEGFPKGAIVEIAEGWGADLIVVGSHGYGALHRFFLGSVSNAVATHAHCSVQIVRCAEKNERGEKK